MSSDYPRDLLGYGQHTPNASWPNKAAIAVQFVINVEEGGENTSTSKKAVKTVSCTAMPHRKLSCQR